METAVWARQGGLRLESSRVWSLGWMARSPGVRTIAHHYFLCDVLSHSTQAPASSWVMDKIAREPDRGVAWRRPGP